MVVKTQCKGHRITGLDVGVNNVQRYFPDRIPAIELHIGHLHIRCHLDRDFWEGRPEIHDPRISDWLRSRHVYPKGNRDAVSLELVEVGKNSFRLRVVQRNVCPTTSQPCPVCPESIHPSPA